MITALEWINRFVWGIPALLLILGVGAFLSIRTGFVQFSLFPKAVRHFSKHLRQNSDNKGFSSHQSLCTALAATVGTGNLAGVAGAIAIGGPGTIFWMWICGFLGMMTKFAEAALSVVFRRKNNRGEYFGGPMYMIRYGMGTKWSWLAVLYCVFGIIAAFGIGNATQINAVVDGVNAALRGFGWQETAVSNWCLGILLAGIVLLMLSGGTSRIGRIAEHLVPVGAVFYLLICFGALVLRARFLPNAVWSIFMGAFSPRAMTGGVVCSVFTVLRIGAARGVFTNEAGMGTAAIAYASAGARHPVEQGLMGLIEVFIDTIVICTMTALVVLSSGVPIPFGTDAGMALTIEAFSSIYGNWISIPLSISICFFAIATVLGWGMYGIRCVQFLFGERMWKPFVILQSFTAVFGAVLNTGTVWMLSETVNGLMTIPNLIALAYLSPDLIKIIREYKTTTGTKIANGEKNENFNQCKSLRTFSHAEISPLCGEGKGSRNKNLPSEYRST